MARSGESTGNGGSGGRGLAWRDQRNGGRNRLLGVGSPWRGQRIGMALLMGTQQPSDQQAAVVTADRSERMRSQHITAIGDAQGVIRVAAFDES